VKEKRAQAPIRTAPKPVERNTRERVIDGVLDVVAEHGVEGLTHRRVAEAVGVPLGTTTYHFDSREDMLVAGMTAMVERDMRQVKAHFAALPPGTDLATALTELIIRSATQERTSSVLIAELFVAALRRERLREIALLWDQRWRDLLQAQVGEIPAATAASAASWLILRSLLEGRAPNRKMILAVMRQSLGEAQTSNI
jgi:TetR/AcrR family transcriptional regulator, regulator of biofilm formation and stress response